MNSVGPSGLVVIDAVNPDLMVGAITYRPFGPHQLTCVSRWIIVQVECWLHPLTRMVLTSTGS